MSSKLNVVILAAGKGTRMYSETPKVLHELAGRSLVEHVIATANKLKPECIVLVVGHHAEKIEALLQDRNDLLFVRQTEQKGTAHAVEQALPHLDDDSITLVLYGDVPLIKAESLNKLIEEARDGAMSVLTCELADPAGLGRIIRDESGNILAIVEDRDADEREKKINEINTGMMAFGTGQLKKWLPLIKNHNAQNEYYLTDIIPIALQDKGKVKTVLSENETEISGVNNMIQLANLERAFQKEQAEHLMLKGVKLLDPLRFDVRGEPEIDTDVQIDANVILEGKVKLEKGVKLGANCILKNCSIGEGTEIFPNTLIEDAAIGKQCSIGPFARIRPGTAVSDQAKIGNFVETKKASVGKGSKVNHLSYIGDSELGQEVNIGAGTITCNYDGANKHLTEIGDKVFIGSNTALIAPVKIARGATVGAGSVITRNVEADELALSRSRQSSIKGWKRPVKDNKK